MKRLWRRIRIFFAWHTVKRRGHDVYQENAITGQRRIVESPIVHGGCSPVDRDWLHRRETEPAPPRGGSGVPPLR